METRGRAKRAAARDRLSNLPDCLLQAILSQLRSRQVVETSALSWRWRHLSRAVPCIHIDSDDFPIQIVEDSEDAASEQDDDDRNSEADWCVRDQRLFEAEEDALAELADFADNLLFHHSLSGEALDTLRLRIHRQDDGRRHGSTEKDMISRWIRRGLRLSPAAIDITIDGVPMRQPSYFSNAGACFGRLAKLRIDDVLLSQTIENLFGTNSLPALQDLEIRNSALGYIVSDTLRNQVSSVVWQEDPYAQESDEEQDLETATMAMNLKLVQIVHGNNKLRSKIKRKLPRATISK